MKMSAESAKPDARRPERALLAVIKIGNDHLMRPSRSAITSGNMLTSNRRLLPRPRLKVTTVKRLGTGDDVGNAGRRMDGHAHLISQGVDGYPASLATRRQPSNLLSRGGQ